MDVQMPEMDGLEATRAICTRWLASERPRIISMTASAMQGDREMCLQGGYIDENGIAYMDTAEALAGAQWIDSFRPYGTPNGEHMVCRNELVTGNVAIWWTGPWAIPDLVSTGLDFGIASMGSPFVGIKSYMMTPNAISRNNQPAVAHLLTYLGSPGVQRQLALAIGTIPANSAALADPAVQALYATARFGESLNRGVPMGNSPYIMCQWLPVGEETNAIWQGIKTPQQAMTDAQNAIETCIAGMQ
jgi:ABC-type glycerol-3-phosphate transport system substrate-binding protein